MATIGDGLVSLYYMPLLSSCGAAGYKFRSMPCARNVTHEYFMLHSFSIEFIVSRCYSPSRSAARVAPRWASGGWASVGGGVPEGAPGSALGGGPGRGTWRRCPMFIYHILTCSTLSHCTRLKTIILNNPRCRNLPSRSLFLCWCCQKGLESPVNTPELRTLHWTVEPGLHQWIWYHLKGRAECKGQDDGHNRGHYSGQGNGHYRTVDRTVDTTAHRTVQSRVDTTTNRMWTDWSESECSVIKGHFTIHDDKSATRRHDKGRDLR